ncbi:helix-turn-helix domain-containing protein [Alphaproteobacteria bacterium GH1-50]|uniref:Helix-turn-helix domain-containing protein n=1 Tax=Kangsaoukella pontilimi TaxID=2691042 RepID=A0A7C9J2Z9_9RHOB|nr:Crp/Fnr family transcriptional regulator [Kangsaoukella pontilimi]MXQ07921.1 helix-turn-helix domain-containing protein [Kangsaoukella pontilimi]
MRDQIKTGEFVHPLSVCANNLGGERGLTREDENAFFTLPHTPMDARRGQEFVAVGAKPRAVFLVLDGWAMRCVPLADGRRQILSVALPGDIVGLDSLAIGTSDYAAVAFSHMSLAAVEPSAFLRVMTERSGLRDCVNRVEALEALHMRNQILRLGRLNAKERIAHFLWEVHGRLARVGRVEDGMMSFPMTQTDLSDALGLSLVHTNRQLQELRRDDLITLRRDRLTIHAPDRLREVALAGAG